MAAERRRPHVVLVTVLAAGVVAAAGCASGGDAAPVTSATTGASITTVPAAPTQPTTSTVAVPVTIPLRIEDRTGTEPGFAAEVLATLTDPRGWARAGFAFVEGDAYAVVLAEGAEVDVLCAPYDTASTYSCQRGPVVALNADRWRRATPEWPAGAGLAAYREMLVNHEVGHLLGQHHPERRCPAPGEPAPVMAQQSTDLPGSGCLANPWPLDWEVACAAQGVEPLAPPYEPDPSPTCGPPGPDPQPG